MELPTELQVPQPQEQMQQPAASQTPIGDAMQQGVEDATGDFITTMVKMLESKGIDLDEAMNLTVSDQADIAQGDADPSEFLSEEDLVLLVQKFNALEPDAQAQLEQAFIKELPPRFVQRLRAVQKFVGGRGI